jgi:AraC-like DNA-binding protein
VARQSVRVHTVSGCEGLELVEGDYPDFRFARHAHPHFTISVVTRGAQRLLHRGQKAIVRRGDVILLNPDAAHSNEPAARLWSHVSVCPTEAMLRSLLPDFSEAKFRPRSAVVHDAHVATRITQLLSLCRKFANPLEVQELTQGLLTDVFDRYGNCALTVRSNAPIEKIRERLADAPEVNIGLSELADEVGTSPTALLRSFTNAVGCTPHTYQTARRIHRSKQLLRNRVAIIETALLCGFVDQSHFTRTFKGWTGMTPARYRAETRRT